MPVLHLSDGVVTVRGTKCVNGNDSVTLSGNTQWRRVEGSAITTIAGTSGSVRREPGCKTFEFRNVMPSRLTTGLWQITGSETASGEGLFTGVTQTKVWDTEFFRIEP